MNTLAWDFAPYLTVDTSALPDDVSAELIKGMNAGIIRFTYHECVAVVGCGYTTEGGYRVPWATVYNIATSPDLQNKGQASHLLTVIKAYYESQGYDFGCSNSDSDALNHLIIKLGITRRL